MKVVLVSNFNIETVNDILYAKDLTLEEASKKAREYNVSHPIDSHPYWAKVVEDDYKLHVWEP